MKFPPINQALIQKYSTAGPRYTSYPTAVEFHPRFDAAEWRTALNEEFSPVAGRSLPSYRGLRDSLAIYFHLPFCHSLCYFCACTKVISADKSVVTPYLSALKAEIALYRELVGGDKPVEQIHWGGGTPNYFSPAQMSELHKATVEAFPNLSDGADVSVEIDPRTVTREHLEVLRSLGFNRVSFGVQDFNPEVQTTINRIQPYEMTRDVCDWSRELGFSGINIDLIYGLPMQSLEGFDSTMDRVLELRPDRIALYGYAHVTWMKKVQKVFDKAPLPTPEERIELLLLGMRRLVEAGYVHIGMDHFSLPNDGLAAALEQGRLNRNFMGYTTHRGVRLLGLGASSISTLPSAFAQNVKEVGDYQKRVAAGEFPTERGLRCSADDRLRCEIIEAIMCRETISIPEFERVWKISFQEYFGESLSKLAPLVEDGLVTIDASALTVTPLGSLFARNIAMCFDAYLEVAQKRSKQVFSKTI